MSSTNNNVKKYLGYKFFKELEDGSIVLIRMIGIDEFNNKVKIKNLETGKTSTILFDTLKGYTPLEPYGFMSFAKVGIKDYENNTTLHDVIVSIYKLLDIKLDINEPYAICRQSVTDFFYTIISNDPAQEVVGVCCSRDNCPTNIPYHTLASCDEVLDFTIVNFYITDIIKDILDCLDTSLYDKVLRKLYDSHMESINPLYDKKLNKNPKPDKGWCPNLESLLIENNVITDLDIMRNITAVDFKIEDELVYKTENDLEIASANKDLLLFINYTFKINAVNTIVIEFDVDVDLADFNNMNYILIRDSENKTYIISYTIAGEYREQELVEEMNALGVGDRLRLAFYNKYSI